MPAKKRVTRKAPVANITSVNSAPTIDEKVNGLARKLNLVTILLVLSLLLSGYSFYKIRTAEQLVAKGGAAAGAQQAGADNPQLDPANMKKTAKDLGVDA